MSKSNSHAGEPTVISDTNLSRAWSRLFLGIFDSRRTEVSPLTMSLAGFDDDGAIAEIAAVRDALDQTLKLKLALLWQIFWIDRRNWIPESDFQ